MTANDGTKHPAEAAGEMPHVIGRPSDGLSVVSVNGSHHAVLLVSDLEGSELAQLSKFVSVPLTQRLGRLVPGRGTSPASISVAVQELAWAPVGLELDLLPSTSR
jgi:hypothetical protein